MSKLLWHPSPDRIANSRLREFANLCESNTGLQFSTYSDLHKWSIDSTESFWSLLWDYADIIGEKGDTIVRFGATMPSTQFFPEAKLSYAQNLLRRTDDSPSIIFRGEDKVRVTLSWSELSSLVSRLQQAFVSLGIKRGDRIAAMLPNIPETIACMLAANSLGAIWSSCSPDFGEQGVLDRFSQITPTLFISCDGYWYNGTKISVSEKVENIATKLSVPHTLIIPYTADSPITYGISLSDFLAPFASRDLTFESLPFNHPLYILFSSGTTGIPKCIVHSQGGILLKHLSEQILHCDIRLNDKTFYFTTCGWMMWNWLVSALSLGSTLMLYDGSPFHPDGNTIFNYASEEEIDFLGVSAKFIDAVRNSGLRPIASHNLSSLRTIASTGSPLSYENFEFVYDSIKQDVHLSSMSGGTDIAGCFVMGSVWNPVYSGEIQVPVLGMATDVYDDNGSPITLAKGELVCSRPFPSMPISFWGDDSNEKYHNAYFGRFPNIWCHGDFAEWTKTGGMIIHGRSDATLNPGGVRIGTSEIYNHAESLDIVEECICIGQQWQSDTRIVLFVRLSSGAVLDESIKSQICDKIRSGASPRHVPKVIIQVSDIPRTRSGKITELAVSDIVHGREVKNKDALLNPESLDLFADLSELKV